jgi:hypothetical protein
MPARRCQGRAGAAALRDAIWRLDDAPDMAALVRAMQPE